jgi:hypothetical protein
MGARRDMPPDPMDALVKSYRYLRIAIVLVLVVLGASIGSEWFATAGDHCLQGSISAYYYTPVQPILVGALLAMGTCMIAVKGNSLWEDTALNLAGMVAPLVALVPTSGTGNCMSVAFAGQETGPGISNNVTALLIGGVVAALVGLFMGLRDRRENLGGRPVQKPTWWGLAIATALIVGAIFWYRVWRESFLDAAHYTAAVTMFIFVGVAAGTNGFYWRGRGWNPLRWLRAREGGWASVYRSVPIGMILAGAATLAIGEAMDSKHTVFVLEFVEIGFFILYWVTQTAEQWDQGLRSS